MIKQKPTRKRVDWDSIYPLYRIGNLSNYQITTQYAADHKNSQTYKPTVSEAMIRKHAKLKKWKKNLAKDVSQKVKEKLVRNQVRNANQKDCKLTDEEIIDQAAEAGANVVTRHREEIRALIRYEEDLLDELGGDPIKFHISNHMGKVKKTKLSLTLKERTTILKDLTICKAKRIALERQAHNIDDEDADKGIEQELMDL